MRRNVRFMATGALFGLALIGAAQSPAPCFAAGLFHTYYSKTTTKTIVCGHPPAAAPAALAAPAAPAAYYPQAAPAAYYASLASAYYPVPPAAVYYPAAAPSISGRRRHPVAPNYAAGRPELSVRPEFPFSGRPALSGRPEFPSGRSPYTAGRPVGPGVRPELNGTSTRTAGDLPRPESLLA